MEKNLLTPNQRRILELISEDKVICKQFYLTGGTALSYFYFKHRFSEDLDFFSENEYDSKKLLISLSNLKKKLKPQNLEQQRLTGQNVFYFSFKGGSTVKVDFAYFPFAHLGKFKKIKKMRISSLEDTAVNKLHAITTRKRSRDYLDLYMCIRELNWEVTDLQKNYKLKFDIYLPFEQLATTFVNVLDARDMPIFLGKGDFVKVQNYFLKLSETLKKRIID